MNIDYIKNQKGLLHISRLIILMICIVYMNILSCGQNAFGGHSQLNAIMNNYQAHYCTDNDMFWDFSINVAHTFIPKNSNSSPIFAGSCWMGGYVGTNNI